MEIYTRRYMLYRESNDHTRIGIHLLFLQHLACHVDQADSSREYRMQN